MPKRATTRCGYEVAAILVVKVVLLAIIWHLCFAHLPIKQDKQLTRADMAAHLLS
jgi:hypothetical protein